MENTKNKTEQYELAAKRVKKVKGFYKHLIVFIFVNIFIIATNYYYQNPNESFFSFKTFSTAFFWGIGLAAHGLSVFLPGLFFGQNWEQRKIDELMKKNENK
jgi:2TM domain